MTMLGLRVWWWLGKAGDALYDLDMLDEEYSPMNGHCCSGCAAGPQVAASQEKLQNALDHLKRLSPDTASAFIKRNGL